MPRPRVTIELLPLWSVVRGIGHVVLSRDDSSIVGTRWACGSLGDMRGFRHTKPRRVCRACRKAIEDGLLDFAKEIQS